MNENAPTNASLPEVLGQIRRLAASDDESARTAATTRLTQLLEEEFDAVLDATQEWALDPDRRIREVTLRACEQPAATTDEARVRHLLGRVERFIGDPDPAIDDRWSRVTVPHLLAIRPEVVLPWLREWTKNPETRARAGVARALGAIGGRYPTEAVEGIAELGSDPRAPVREAVVGALEEIREQYPQMGPYLDGRFGLLLRSE
ncbi:MAG TPA: HEAT repeat domain-containing protein [Thermoplasmata archaeon]|nr:HEAT repeat domain-containing protein [Thermoplasmata archaeon]